MFAICYKKNNDNNGNNIIAEASQKRNTEFPFIS